MKNLIIILFVNVVYSNINFQITDLPKDIYSFNYNNGILNQKNKTIITNTKYSTSYFQYPAQISLLNFKIQNHFSLSLLNYDRLEDKINDEIIYDFTAYEVLMQYHFFKHNRYYNIYFSPAMVYSQISYYSASALFADFHLLFKYPDVKNLNVIFSLKKIGFILNNYINHNEYLPIDYHFGVSKGTNNNTNFAFDIFYHGGFKKSYYVFSVNNKINNKISLLASINSNKNDLNINNTINDVFSGLNFGLIIHDTQYNIGFGIGSIGPAGDLYGFSLEFK